MPYLYNYILLIKRSYCKLIVKIEISNCPLHFFDFLERDLLILNELMNNIGL